MLIPFDEGITTVVGRTRSGKTYGTIKSLAAQRRGVLFFNTQLEKVDGFTKADGKNNFEQIKAALAKGKKINFIPSTVDVIRKKQLTFLINQFFDGHTHDFYFVVDEVHLFKDSESLGALIRLATGGLRFGMRGVWISQRGAKIDNTLMTQSTRYVFYDSNLEGPYYRGYGIPYDEIQQKIQQMPLFKGSDGVMRTYAYCIFDGKTIEGAYKV